MNLVTGGAGFIGSHLVNTLLAEKEEVRVLERPGTSVDHLPLDRVELVRADIRERVAMDRATRDCHHVFHLAADPNLWRRDIAGFDTVNHRGAVNVIEAALNNGAERILHTSTESILTSQEFNGGAVEDLELREEDMIGPYCLSKYHADRAAREYAAQGAPVLLASPTLPVGPGDRNMTPPTRMSVAFCRGELPAYLDCRFNLVDARDVALGMLAVVRRGRPGRRYLLGGHNYHLGEWLGTLGIEIGRAAPRWKVPYSVALGVAWISEKWATHVTGTMPMATVTGVRLTQRSMHFDTRASTAELGLEPRDVQESAHDAVNWYREQRWI